MTYAQLVKVITIIAVTGQLLLWLHGGFTRFLANLVLGICEWPAPTAIIAATGAIGVLIICARIEAQ